MLEPGADPERVAREGGNDNRSRVGLAFRLAYGRNPDRAETDLALAFLDRDPSFAHLALALINANEFVYID